MCESHWALRACTGIFEMSRCHQLLAGKTGHPAMRGVTGLAASAVSGSPDAAGRRAASRSTGQQ